MPQDSGPNHIVAIGFAFKDRGDIFTPEDQRLAQELGLRMAMRFGGAVAGLVELRGEDELGNIVDVYHGAEVIAFPDHLSDLDLTLLYKWATELGRVRPMVNLTIDGDNFRFSN